MAMAAARSRLAAVATKCSPKLPFSSASCAAAAHHRILFSAAAGLSLSRLSSLSATTTTTTTTTTTYRLFSSNRDGFAVSTVSAAVHPSDEAKQDWMVEWEEEDEEAEPEIGDGGDGGGVALGDVGWGGRALSAARDVLAEHFGDDVSMFAFKVSPRGYVYVRLDKLTNKYGCPTVEEIESFNNLYKQKLDEIVESGEIPLDLALEVSSPGAERLLKVPHDLDRFKEMPMRVEYLEDDGSKQSQQKDGIFLLEVIDAETEHCVWKLADVKENRAEAGKGRPLSRKQRDWRLQTPFAVVKRVTLYLESKR